MTRCTDCKREKPSEDFYHKQRRCRPCMAKRNREWHRADPRRGMLKAAKRRAKQKGLECTITLEDIVVPDRCPVLGIKLVPGASGTQGPTPASPSVDRIDPAGGYTPDNVMVVSFRANQIKSSASPDEIRKVAEFYTRLAG